MKKIICLLVVYLTFFSVIAGCSEQNDIGSVNTAQNTELATVTDWYDILEYEKSGDIKDCQKLEYGTQCETYSFLYDSNGYWVKGFISIPQKCIQEKTPYNCIVYNRGGNANMGFVTGEEIAAICDATDRVVIASQYRGANGGEGVDEFGGSDIGDVISLVDLCECKFEFIDIKNLCMFGVSRGGMMTYIAARQDKRVKGIIAISAVTDLVASYNERDDMRVILSNSIGGSPEELPKEYEERSAINWAEEINVPVFIVHSKYDEMVSVSQAEAMSQKLKTLNKDCTVKFYEDSVHGFHNDDILILINWLNQKLPRN